MEQISFTITEDVVREIAKDITKKKLSIKKIRLVLDMVECDEMLWKDINNSITNAIYEINKI